MNRHAIKMGKEKKKVITMSLFNMYTHVYILNFYDRFHSSSHCSENKVHERVATFAQDAKIEGTFGKK